MDFTRIKKINFENEIFDIGDNDIEEILKMLDINHNNVQMEVEEDTLYILNKTGTKGNDFEEFYEEENEEDEDLEDNGIEFFDIEHGIKEKLERMFNKKERNRVKVDFVDGKLIEKNEKTEVVDFLKRFITEAEELIKKIEE